MGNERKNEKLYKINLHTHTTESDGKKTPEEAVAIYRAAGYDAIAITDHWRVGMAREIDGMPILAGCEYNFGLNESRNDTTEYGVYHILGLCYERDPGVTREDDIRTCVDKIHAAGGIAVLAHPAWSLNQPDHVMTIDDFDATEIYNTVSGVAHSNRPYSGAFVDLLAAKGKHYPLLATDDVHYYEKDGASSAILVSLPELTGSALKKAIRKGDFYATMGGVGAPTLSVTKQENGVHVECSPVSEINFFSNLAWAKNHHIVGEKMTSYDYEFSPYERYIRVEAIDGEGRTAYSCFLFRDGSEH